MGKVKEITKYHKTGS